MATLLDENRTLALVIERMRLDLEQAWMRIEALEQALEARQPALDEAHAKIAKYRLEIVGLLDQLAKGG